MKTTKRKTGSKSHLELKFLKAWEERHGLALRPVRQLHFAKKIGRRWALDFAWPALRVGVEIDGGIFVGGGHNRGVQFTNDCEKMNAAIFLGWRILTYTTLDIRQRPKEMIAEVTRLLELAPSLGRLQKALFETVETAEPMPF